MRCIARDALDGTREVDISNVHEYLMTSTITGAHAFASATAR